jgi:DNA-binding MarR family transcriptional regulator
MVPAGLVDELSRCWRELGAVLASRRVLAAMGASSDSGLTPTRLRALDLLAESGSLRISGLAAGMRVDETTATRLADRLEGMGVAKRVRATGDRRATDLVLTAHGERLVAEVSASRREFFREVLDALERDERAELVRLTAKAATALRVRADELVAR